jgi:hypothetical protein
LQVFLQFGSCALSFKLTAQACRPVGAATDQNSNWPSNSCAKALGFDISPTLLVTSGEVIE